MKRITALPVCTLAALLVTGAALAPRGALGQDSAEDAAAESTATSAEAGERIDALEERLAEQQQRIDALEATEAERRAEVEGLEQQLSEVQEQQDEMALAAMDREVQDAKTDKLLSIWGFFDLTFSKYFYPENSAYNLFISDRASFLMSSVNLYFGSQMTETLSALVELKLSYYPHGWEDEWEYEDVPGSEYNRTDTRVRDPFTTQFYRQHGITLERVHLTWSPVDWFNVIAGRFLTPYGIWNIDHGSPVVLPIRVPYLQIREMVPLAQTGLQVYGRFFPAAELFLDYAVTFSNGRGPMDEVFDLDNNKGVGLRLRGAYESEDVTVAVGGYGYYGAYTDTKKVVDLQLVEDPADPDYGTLDESKTKPILVDVVNVEQYDEVAVSADLLVEVRGVRLQGEYIWRRVDYNDPKVLTVDDVLFAGGTPFDTYYSASFVGHGVYGLIAWELPLSRWIDPVRITPYFMCEYNRHDDTLPYQNLTTYIGGINIKPSPFVTLKVEGGGAVAEKDLYGGNLKAVAAQLAVSF